MADHDHGSEVAKPSEAYKEMARISNWDLIHDLLGGTRAMIEAGQRWLPREPGEEDDGYKIRLSRSLLFEAFGETIGNLVAQPFSKPMSFSSMPENLEYLEDNADGSGNDIECSSNQNMTDMLTYGLSHILIDHTPVPLSEDGEPISIADEEALGARTNFVKIAPPNLIGWRSEMRDGVTVLTQIRFRDTRTINDGLYGERTEKLIRVYTETDWEIHVFDEKTKKYNLSEVGPHTFGAVPLVTIYANKTGFMTAISPFLALAYINLGHWRSDSDQRNILRFSRFGLLFASGFSEEQVESKEKSVGPTVFIKTTAENADMKYVEPKGTAIAAGRDDLKDLERKMQILGFQPFAEGSGMNTATEASIDERRTQTAAQAWIKSLERGVTQAFEAAARWIKEKLPEDFAVDIFSDFKANLFGDADADLLTKMCLSGKLTLETLLKELNRRGKFADDFIPADEVERVDDQGLPPGFISGEGDGGNEGDE